MHESTDHQLTVLSAKVRQPRPGVTLLPRPRLLPAIRQALQKKLLVLSAEAGYGKTSLLLSSLPELALPAAWFTLDEADTDLNLFAADLVGALRSVVTDFGEDVLQVLTSGPSETVLRNGLVLALESLPEIAVVLDDFHVVDSSQQVQDLIDYLLGPLPPQVHLIVATRTWPRLRALPRLLVSGEAATLDKTALGFTADEVSAFFRHSHGFEIDHEHARHLTHRTEGWPAALQLVALAAKARGTPALEGTPCEIFDYLAATVLEALPVETQEFLLRTSILHELSPSLCGALIEQGDPTAMLEAIDRSNLFLYRLDEASTRYRYHQLFAEFLQHHLSRRGSETVAALHRRAGQHLEAQGIGDQAVRHYLAAGLYADAERVMKPYHGDRLTARQAYVFREIVTRLPEEVQGRYPWMLRTAASSARFVGDYQGALTFARRAMAAAEGIDPNLWAFSVHGVGVMYSYMDRFEDAVALYRQALPRLDDRVEPRMRGGILSVLADCLVQLGDLTEAERTVDQLRTVALQGSQPGKGYGPAILSGLIAAARFEYSRAREYFRESLRHAEERGSLTYKTSGFTEMARLEIASGNAKEALSTLQQARALHEETGERATDLILTHLAGDADLLVGDLAAAAEMYQQTLAKCREGESEEPRVWAYLGLARVARARGKFAEAESLLNATAQICERVKLEKIIPLLRLEQLSLLRETGRAGAMLKLLPVLREIFVRWESRPGQARCSLFEARLRWEVAGGDELPAEVKPALREALAHSAAAPEDIIPFLRTESSWAVPLLIQSLKEQVDKETTEGLLAGLGPAAVEPLIEGLKDPALRLPAARLLGRIGDPRARRPLTRFVSGGDPEVRSVAEKALALLREPEPVALRILLLGRFEVYRNEEQIGEGAWKTQKVKTLFKYLLLHRDRSVHLDQLIDLLWPEGDARSGATNLKAAVKNLRQALEPLLEGTRSHFVLREGQTLRFRAAASCLVDLEDYQHLLEEARRHEVAGSISEAVAAYERAVALYRGDLLSEDLYEDWTALDRERWREEQIEALAALARLYAGRGEHQSAVLMTQRVLELDRLREAAYRDLMRYSLLRGDRHGAIRTFRTCERLLREELGIAPEPETLALYGQATGPA